MRLATVAAILVVASPLGVVAQEPWPTRDWASASPAEVGLDAKVLAAFDADLAAGKYGLVDSMLALSGRGTPQELRRLPPPPHGNRRASSPPRRTDRSPCAHRQRLDGDVAAVTGPTDDGDQLLHVGPRRVGPAERALLDLPVHRVRGHEGDVVIGIGRDVLARVDDRPAPGVIHPLEQTEMLRSGRDEVAVILHAGDHPKGLPVLPHTRGRHRRPSPPHSREEHPAKPPASS